MRDTEGDTRLRPREPGDRIAQPFATGVRIKSLRGMYVVFARSDPGTRRRKVDAMSGSKKTHRDLDAWKFGDDTGGNDVRAHQIAA